jgi:hypothetical protein
MDEKLLAALATAAVGAAAKEVAAGAVSGAKAVYVWIRGKLTSPGGQEAVTHLEQAPDASENQDALRAALVKLLKANPTLAEELKGLLPAEAQANITQIANVSGAGARVAQVAGSGNVQNLGDGKD